MLRTVVFFFSSVLSWWCLVGAAAHAASVPSKVKLISLFPLNQYEQAIDHWVPPTDPNYDTPILSAELQQKHMQRFYQHYIGSESPWSQSYVQRTLGRTQTSNHISLTEQKLIKKFSNVALPALRKGYAENFRAYPPQWIRKISENMNVAQLEQLSYSKDNRAIAVTNLQARALPTDEVYFHHHEIAGQGYPFDNLQLSALWAGTPLYIVAQTRDAAWYLVITADFIGWVHSDGVVRAEPKFIHAWRAAAEKQLAVITHTEASIQHQGVFQFLAYVGTVLPAEAHADGVQLMIPLRDNENHAKMGHASVSLQHAALLPWLMTPHHLARVIHSLIHRPYGWGNAYFYNDCSAELKNLLAPFGIWLARNSKQQLEAGRVVDVSYLSLTQRLRYLQQHGQPWLTLIYVDGHVMLYIGNYPNPKQKDHVPMVMTYQNVWALYPRPPIRRGVIGQAVFFPLLQRYPEDVTLQSQASRRYFKLIYL